MAKSDGILDFPLMDRREKVNARLHSLEIFIVYRGGKKLRYEVCDANPFGMCRHVTDTLPKARKWAKLHDRY